jgi:serine/threonine protein kinase
MAADIWSLGCIMTFCCNRAKPLFSSPVEVIRWRGLQPGDIQGGYSRGLVGLIRRMLSFKAGDRPSAGEVVRECTKERRAEK